MDDFVFGVSLFNADGVCCYGTNTYIEEMEPLALAGERGGVVRHRTASISSKGTYKLDVAVHKRDGYPYDYHRLLYTFRVKSRDARRRHLSARRTGGRSRSAFSSSRRRSKAAS